MTSSRKGTSKKRSRGIPVGGGIPFAGELETLKQNEVILQTRNKTLEVEVETVKARLEALRRAKSTTIIRREREREEVHVSAERLARLPRCSAAPTGHTPHQQASPVGSLAPGETTPTGTPCRHGNLKEENEQLKLQVDELRAQLLSERLCFQRAAEETAAAHTQVLADLKSKGQCVTARLRAELNALKCMEVKCERHEKLSQQLRVENSELDLKMEELIAANALLRECNEMMQGKCEGLVEDLSVKEALWSEREETFKAEIRQQWGDRYSAWIAKAERKMEELQQINTLLQGMVKTQQLNPDL